MHCSLKTSIAVQCGLAFCKMLLACLTLMMYAWQELKGVQGACEVLEQTVAHLKRRLNAEEVMRAELTGT